MVHGDESGNPAIGALKGLIRVLAYEHPDLRATLVDLDTADDAVATMMTELESSGSDDVIAWRGKRRYVERLSRATLGERQRDSVVRPDGVVHRHRRSRRARSWSLRAGSSTAAPDASFSTVGPSPSDEQRRSLADLESRAEVVFVEGDIASPGVAERLVTAAEETGLPLRGVVHWAAVLDDRLVAALSRESLERVWAPKAAGALRLHEATATRKLDWWVGFSSTSPRCWARPGRRRTRARMRGSMPWSRGDEHRVCLPPRSIGASGPTSASPAH